MNDHRHPFWLNRTKTSTRFAYILLVKPAMALIGVVGMLAAFCERGTEDAATLKTMFRGTRPEAVESHRLNRSALLLEQASGVRWSVSPPSGPAPLTVTFEASDNAGGANYNWNFGDGNTAIGPKVRYTYYKPGDFKAQLEVRFPNGARSQGEIPIRAANAGPERARMTILVDTGTDVMFDARASIVYAPLSSARWNFGDGTTAEGLTVRKAFAPGKYTVRLELTAPSGRLVQSLPVRAGLLSGNPTFEEEVLRLTNDARARGFDCETKTFPARGRAIIALRRNPQLDVAARAQSAAMALNDYFAHESALDGSKPADRATASGYAWWNIAENIASGQETPASVVTAWLQSHGHCVNIMSPDLIEIGVSYVLNAQNRPYWTQVFGKPRD
jgi:uncharacterized protein YkwD